MRVMECNICGETIGAANARELAARLGDHLRSEHAQDPDAAELERLVARDAYEATDS